MTFFVQYFSIVSFNDTLILSNELLSHINLTFLTQRINFNQMKSDTTEISTFSFLLLVALYIKN